MAKTIDGKTHDIEMLKGISREYRKYIGLRKSPPTQKQALMYFESYKSDLRKLAENKPSNMNLDSSEHESRLYIEAERRYEIYLKEIIEKHNSLMLSLSKINVFEFGKDRPKKLSLQEIVYLSMTRN